MTHDPKRLAQALAEASGGKTEEYTWTALVYVDGGGGGVAEFLVRGDDTVGVWVFDASPRQALAHARLEGATEEMLRDLCVQAFERANEGGWGDVPGMAEAFAQGFFAAVRYLTAADWEDDDG
ncbi:MAG: hypothetical protein ACOC9T_02055 [Myxococcota bacterium]